MNILNIFKTHNQPFTFQIKKMKLNNYIKQVKEEWSEHWFEFILSLDSNKLCWQTISQNTNVTWKLVCRHPDKPWHFNMLSQSREITLEIIESNPDKPWDYFYLSRNPNLTLDYVLQHPHLPWNWICLSANKV